MPMIVIQDLSESVDLDRQAMAAITGGALVRGRQTLPGRAIFRSARLINDPLDPADSALAQANARTAGKDTARLAPGVRESARARSTNARED